MQRDNESLIQRAVRILNTFEFGDTYLSASEIARRTGIPVPTTHRIVAELVRSGVLERGEQRQVCIGLHLWELANRSPRQLVLREAALPYMADLQAVFKQHTQLSVLDGTDVVYIERLSARGAVANITQMASRLPALTCSPGLVFAAHAATSLRQAMLASPPVAFTPDSVVDPAALNHILATVRESGVAVVKGWVHRDVTGVAVPILDAEGTVLASLSVLLPRAGEAEHSCHPALLTTARAISRALQSRKAVSDPELHLLKHKARNATHKPALLPS